MGGTRQWRQSRIARGLCVECGAPRISTDSAAVPTATRCAACATRHRDVNRALRAEKRKTHGWNAGGDGTPLPFGGAAPRLHAVTCVRVRLDTPTLEALGELKRRYRDIHAGDNNSPFLPFQLSRLVRETIHRWKHTTSGYRRPTGAWFCHRNLALNIQADAVTLNIVDREARRWFSGNRAATIRAMLISTVNPPIIVGRARPRRRLGGEDHPDPWNDD